MTNWMIKIDDESNESEWEWVEKIWQHIPLWSQSAHLQVIVACLEKTRKSKKKSFAPHPHHRRRRGERLKIAESKMLSNARI